jgi:hypothetical protein
MKLEMDVLEAVLLFFDVGIRHGEFEGVCGDDQNNLNFATKKGGFSSDPELIQELFIASNNSTNGNSNDNTTFNVKQGKLQKTPNATTI